MDSGSVGRLGYYMCMAAFPSQVFLYQTEINLESGVERGWIGSGEGDHVKYKTGRHG